MHIRELSVVNFRGVRDALLTNLGDTVVVAGPNGSGKSCLFDAIRLLKTSLGGYQANEWQQFFSEFQIQARDSSGLSSLFRDPKSRVQIRATFELSSTEQDYLLNLDWESIANVLLASRNADGGTAPPLALVDRAQKERIRHDSQWWLKQIKQELKHHSGTLSAAISIDSNLSINTTKSPTLEAAFQLYEPENIGIIDYHGPHRSYARERVGGIQLSRQGARQRASQHALYNYANKYRNVKAELTSAYLRDLVASESDSPDRRTSGILDAMHSLFDLFFPDKKFLGPTPRPDGSVDFPVQVADGSTHDINDLSSGEKEIVFGYLRLVAQSPKNSIILIDEPELHLNPALVSNLPHFYHSRFAEPLSNQLWLTTHSDAFLRSAMSIPNVTAYHMKPSADRHKRQSQRVSVDREIDKVVASLVGNMATHAPDAKVVILEGEDSEFDLDVVTRLFPKFGARVKLLSGGNKSSVKKLREHLRRAAEEDLIQGEFFAITDRDDDSAGTQSVEKVLAWDRYHIENYLLEPALISQVLSDLHTPMAEDEVLKELRVCAKQSIRKLLLHRIETHVWPDFTEASRLDINRSHNNIGVAVCEALDRSVSRIRKAREQKLTNEYLMNAVRAYQSQLDADLHDDRWIETFRGRDILKQFAHRHADVGYEPFRNLIISSMQRDAFQPPGMKSVLLRIDPEAFGVDDSG